MTDEPDLECTEAAAEIELLHSQLPDEMQHCTIRFLECERGHGRLTATNWVPHPCSTCEIDRLTSEQTKFLIANAKLEAEIGRLAVDSARLKAYEVTVREQAGVIARQRATIEFVSTQVRSITPDWKAVWRWLDDSLSLDGKP
jgi:hypothetical protein